MCQGEIDRKWFDTLGEWTRRLGRRPGGRALALAAGLTLGPFTSNSQQRHYSKTLAAQQRRLPCPCFPPNPLRCARLLVTRFRLHVVAVKIEPSRPWPQVATPHVVAAVAHRPRWKSCQTAQHGVSVPQQAEEQPRAYPVDQGAHPSAWAGGQAQSQGAPVWRRRGACRTWLTCDSWRRVLHWTCSR